MVVLLKGSDDVDNMSGGARQALLKYVRARKQNTGATNENKLFSAAELIDD